VINTENGTHFFSPYVTAKPLCPPEIGPFFGTVGRLMNVAELA
jgi:hypothetical protein